MEKQPLSNEFEIVNEELRFYHYKNQIVLEKDIALSHVLPSDLPENLCKVKWVTKNPSGYDLICFATANELRDFIDKGNFDMVICGKHELKYQYQVKWIK